MSESSVPVVRSSSDIIGLWRDYYEITKPRVVALLVLTALVGYLGKDSF